MQNHWAFAARYWGGKAVVCHSSEGRPGPVVDEEFGEFESWTQANVFAAKLNEGLEVSPAEAQQIITDSILRTGELLRNANRQDTDGGPLRGPIIGRSLCLQLIQAELELAVTFCRIVQSKPNENSERLLRNARNALFDAMHFVCQAELTAGELDTVTGRLRELQAALESLAQC